MEKITHYDLQPKDHHLSEDQRVNYITNQLRVLPNEVFTGMQFFSPEAGCVHACAMCSQGAGTTRTRMTKEGLVTVIKAMEIVMKEKKQTSGVSGRILDFGSRPYNPDHIVCYFDNDPASYPYLDTLIEEFYGRLGIKIGISTVGYPQKDRDLQAMHERIANNLTHAIQELRFSFSRNPQEIKKNPDEFLADFANTLRTYQPVIDTVGTGKRAARIELHHEPLVYTEDTYLDDIIIKDRHVIHIGPLLLVSIDFFKERETNFQRIENIYDTSTCPYYVFLSDNEIAEGDWKGLAEKVIDSHNLPETPHFVPFPDDTLKNKVLIRTGQLGHFENCDGEYYSIDPFFNPKTGEFYALQVFPKNNTRLKSGFFDAQRFFLNSLLLYKQSLKLAKFDQFPNAQWDDVDTVISRLSSQAEFMEPYNQQIAQYIRSYTLPLISGFASVIKTAGFPPSFFFDADKVSDTGAFANTGRAFHRFSMLISQPDEPDQPNDQLILEKYLQRGPAWLWSPVPYVPPDVLPTQARIGSKNDHADNLNTIAIRPVDRRNYYPQKGYQITGIPLEQIIS